MNPIKKILALFICLYCLPVFSQHHISGVINQYEAAGPVMGVNSVLCPNAANFQVNDTVLIIQMQGAGIVLDDSATFGNINGINDAGNYEFSIIDSIDIVTHVLYFRCNLSNSYSGLFQIIKVPVFTNAVVDGLLTASPWNGSAGGVLALIADSTLFLNADVDVTGKGFRGAMPSFSTLNSCSSESPDFQRYFYSEAAWDTAGKKGEGIFRFDPGYSRGRGKSATGGGGGHTFFAAGGGGSNYGEGGQGGKEADFCMVQNDVGGQGGVPMSTQTGVFSKLFLGGGGGAGLKRDTAFGDATPGGSGGGIVLIITRQIFGNGHTITANGESVNGLNAKESAGGGGGGGSIMMISPNSSDIFGNLFIEARGGAGGSSTYNGGTYLCVASGGGGGGGVVIMPFMPGALIQVNVSGGSAGSTYASCPSFNGTNGTDGNMINNFIFNPFCFLTNPITNNVISSSQTIQCGDIPNNLTGSIPTGGTNTFTFQWQQSFNDTDWVNCPGISNMQNFSFPSPLNQTTSFRRLAFSGSVNVSNSVKITVTPFIIQSTQYDVTCPGMCNGKINISSSGSTFYTYAWSNGETSQTVSNLCTGGYTVTVTDTLAGCISVQSFVINGPPQLVLNVTNIVKPWCHNSSDGIITVNASGGTPPYTFQWPDGSTGQTATGLSQGMIYVTVTDTNSCFVTDSIFLDAVISITNDTIESNQIICYNTYPFMLEGRVPIGGNGSFTFQWEQSTDSLIWQNAIPEPSTSDTAKDFISVPLTLSTWFRRITFSDLCSDTSNVVFIEVLQGSQKIINNIDATNQYLNYGQTPATITGTPATGGTGDTIRYWWAKFLPGWDHLLIATEGTFEEQNLTFFEGADTSYHYNRIAFILLTPYKMACITPSNQSPRIFVIDSNVIYISNPDVCQGTQPDIIYGNSEINYTYQWQVFNGSSWTDISGATNPNYQPPAGSAMYRRLVFINTNTLTSNTIQINMIPPVSDNHIWTAQPVISDTEIIRCQNFNVPIGNLTSPTGGNGVYSYQWLSSTDNINWSNAPTPSGSDWYYAGASSIVRYYIRQVTSGTCVDSSNSIKLIPLPQPDAGSNMTVCGDTVTMNATSLGLGSEYWTTPNWVTGNDTTSPNAVFSTAQYSNTTFTWHIEYNTCHYSSSITVAFVHLIDTTYAGPDTVIIGKNSVRLNASFAQYSSTGNWSVVSGGGDFDYSGDPRTYVRNVPEGENVYRWSITNAPCPSLYDEVTVKSTKLLVPDGFSPNGDGYNDYFEISNVEFFLKSELLVFNRWGQLVYSKTNYDNSWDGKNFSGKHLPEDTYFIILKIDDTETIKSYLVLKR